MESADFNVSISREFDVPVEELYDAWTKPELLKQWWKPMNKNLTGVTNQLNEGGMIKYAFEDDSLIIEGQYIEVQQREKLVYSWNWRLPKDHIKDSTYKLAVEFSGQGNGSYIRVLQENFENEEGTVPHREGWEKGLNDLKQFLESRKQPSEAMHPGTKLS